MLPGLQTQNNCRKSHWGKQDYVNSQRFWFKGYKAKPLKKTLRAGCRLEAESLHHTQALGSTPTPADKQNPMGIKRSWECFLRAVSTEISIKRGARGNRGPLIQSYLKEVLLPSVLTSSERFINDFILTAQMNWLFSQQQLAFSLSGECLCINA